MDKKDVSISFISFTSDVIVTSERTHSSIKNFIELCKDVVKNVNIIRIMPSKELVKYKNVNYYQVARPFKQNNGLLQRFISYFLTQLLLCVKLVLLCSEINVFQVGGSILLLPIMILHLLGKKVIIINVGEPINFHYSIFHSSNLEKKLVTLLTKIQNFLLLYISSANIFLSKSLAVKYGCLNNKDYFVNLNFINADIFNKKIHFINRTTDFIYVGGIDKEKGVSELISLFSIMVKKNNQLTLRIVGDGPLLNDLKNKVQSNNLSSYINFEGWINHDFLPLFLNESKFIIVPSKTEGLPKVLLEAMSCGTIPIATPVGSIPDIINHGVTGFLFSSSVLDEMASQILTFASNKKLENISDSAVVYIRQNHMYDEVKNKFLAVLDSLL